LGTEGHKLAISTSKSTLNRIISIL